MTDNKIPQRIKDLEFIIENLQNNDAFNIVVEDKKRMVELCDRSWHHIDVSDKDKLLELKYAKHSAEAIVNTIEIYKQELESLKQKTEDNQGYYEDD